MKLIIAVAFAAVVLVAAVAADETTPERMKVVADALRLRDAPSTATGVKIGLLSAGDVVDVLEVSGDWARVRTAGGLTGWACIRLEGETFLSPVASSSGSTAEAAHARLTADATTASNNYQVALADAQAAYEAAKAEYEAIKKNIDELNASFERAVYWGASGIAVILAQGLEERRADARAAYNAVEAAHARLAAADAARVAATLAALAAARADCDAALATYNAANLDAALADLDAAYNAAYNAALPSAVGYDDADAYVAAFAADARAAHAAADATLANYKTAAAALADDNAAVADYKAALEAGD